MTWRYQAYRYKCGGIGIHERYDKGGEISWTVQPIMTLDAEPGDSPARERVRAMERLEELHQMMRESIAVHGIEDYPEPTPA